jgi:hypothetical protein
MQTIKIQLEDTVYQNIVKSGVDIQAKIKEFLLDFVDDGYPAISTEEAKKRVADAMEDYKTNGMKNFSAVDKDFWDDTEKRLLQRHSK